MSTEHDGRLLLQFGIPGIPRNDGHADGASTPTQGIKGSQMPPFGLQTPARMQLEKPDPKVTMRHASPNKPMRLMSPLGCVTVTSHGAVPIVAVPPGQKAAAGGAFTLIIVKSKAVWMH
jgi:hypothetical protein